MICSVVTGRRGDMLGVWIEPVIAQRMKTLSAYFIGSRFPSGVSLTSPDLSVRCQKPSLA
jgi:hypothetical protein